MRRFIISALAALSLAACVSQGDGQASFIRPLPPYVSADSITDAMVPAEFGTAGFNWDDSTLTLDVWSEDIYDAVEVAQMKQGDTLLYFGETLIANTIDRDRESGVITVNGGMEFGGAYLAPADGGTYRGIQMDDHSTYTLLGKTTLPLSRDFRIVICGNDYTDPYDTIKSNQKAFIESIEYPTGEFINLNTTVLVEEGKITEIVKRWIP